MRSAVIAAAFAVSALAVPYQKRDFVTETAVNVVYVTDIVTVTGDGEKAAATPKHYGHGHHHKQPSGGWGGWSGWSTKETSPESTPTPSEAAPAPSPTVATVKTRNTPSPSPTPSGGSGGNGGSGSSGSVGSSYSDITVYHHNIHRKNHSASDIAWDDGLAGTAAKIAASCDYGHNVNMDGGGYGQNIAAGVDAANISAIITNLFYNGEVGWYDGLYGQASPDMSNFEHWGHFSQIVWKGTTHVGCATQDCSSTGLTNTGDGVHPYFTVCNYKSPGNFAGEYGQNVGEPLGHATAQWNTGM